MANYTFDILQSDVFDRISALTHYTGSKKTEDSSAYDRISTIDANDEILSRFWLQAVVQLEIFISPFANNILSEKTIDGSAVAGIFACLNMPSSWDNKLLPALRQASENYLVARISELWFRMTDKEAVAEQMADASASATEIRILLHSKTRPALPQDYLDCECTTHN